jgi:hypothetical protein
VSELERVARFARYALLGAALLGLLALFLPWMTFSSPFGDLPTAEPASGLRLRQWGLLLRLLCACGVGALAVWRGFDRRLGLVSVLLGVLTVFDLVGVAGQAHSALLTSSDVSLASGYYLELIAALVMGVAGVAALILPEEPRAPIPLFDRLLPPYPPGWTPEAMVWTPPPATPSASVEVVSGPSPPLT